MRKTVISLAAVLGMVFLGAAECKPISTIPTKYPTTTTAAPVPVPSGTGGGAGSAAEKFGWGTPVAGDTFDGTALDTKKWGPYNGEGHGGNGRRVPGAFTVSNGLLTVRGASNGDSGGMAYKGGQKFGKWEARMWASAGDGGYHPVLLLWPDAENWPVGGEVDYAEIFDANRQSVNFFLHYSASNQQTQASKKIDATKPHWYAVEWNAGGITGYIDGEKWFSDSNTGHLPPGPMHMTVQLDNFKGTGLKESFMYVDQIAQYK